MIKEYIQINQIVQTILYRALDALDAHYFDNEDYVKGMVGSYIIKDVKNLARLWPEGLPKELLDELSGCAKKDDFQGIILESDLNEYKAIQYLMFASLLARRVEEAKKIKRHKKMST